MYNHEEMLCHMMEEHISGRKFVILRMNPRDSVLQVKKRYSAINREAVVMDFKSNINKDLIEELETISRKAREYYVLIDGNYYEAVNRWFNDNGYSEIKDYIWRVSKPIKLLFETGIDEYRDMRGNEIKNIPARLTLILRGYGNRIVFGRYVVFNENSVMDIDNRVHCVIEASSIFGSENNIKMGNGSDFYIGVRCITHEACQFGIGENAKLVIGNNSTFGNDNFIISTANCEVVIGNDVMTAALVHMRSGDGHVLFDVCTGEKINYCSTRKEKNQTVIGSHVWLGFGSMVISPALIGSGCMVAAKAVVNGKFSNNCILGGVPAKVLKENTAWSRSVFADDMNMGCEMPFAIPTIKKDLLTEEKQNLSTITDFKEYINAISKLDDICILIAVKDTSGNRYARTEKETMMQLGLAGDLIGVLWCGYIAVINNKKVLIEEKGQQNMAIEKNISIDDWDIELISKPLHCGNCAEINVNEYKCSTNVRGFNIVCIDNDSKQVIDSVNFDAHLPGIPCTRKLLSI